LRNFFTFTTCLAAVLPYLEADELGVRDVGAYIVHWDISFGFLSRPVDFASANL